MIGIHPAITLLLAIACLLAALVCGRRGSILGVLAWATIAVAVVAIATSRLS